MHTIVASMASAVRALPLFFAASPRTPLRVLGIVALDALHRLRRAVPLPPATIRAMAAASSEWDPESTR